jgi:molecular chaperone DnaJ
LKSLFLVEEQRNLKEGTTMAKNYYAILGVSPTATFDEIRSAYRQRAKQYHPDYFGKDSAPFMGVQEAYDVLGDPSNRSSYDRNLHEAGIKIRSGGQEEPVIIRSRAATVEPLRPSRRPINLGRIFPQTSFRSGSPSFDEIFGGLWDYFHQPPETKSEKFRALTMEIRLTRDQANRGGGVQIRMPLQHPCSTCNGSGEVGPFQCWKCSGTGSALNEFSLKVEYPPGIQDFYRIAIPLDRYGIRDLCPVLLFRISGEGDFEDYS